MEHSAVEESWWRPNPEPKGSLGGRTVVCASSLCGLHILNLWKKVTGIGFVPWVYVSQGEK